MSKGWRGPMVTALFGLYYLWTSWFSPPLLSPVLAWHRIPGWQLWSFRVWEIYRCSPGLPQWGLVSQKWFSATMKQTFLPVARLPASLFSQMLGSHRPLPVFLRLFLPTSAGFWYLRSVSDLGSLQSLREKPSLSPGPPSALLKLWWQRCYISCHSSTGLQDSTYFSLFKSSVSPLFRLHHFYCF